MAPLKIQQWGEQRMGRDVLLKFWSLNNRFSLQGENFLWASQFPLELGVLLAIEEISLAFWLSALTPPTAPSLPTSMEPCHGHSSRLSHCLCAPWLFVKEIWFRIEMKETFFCLFLIPSALHYSHLGNQCEVSPHNWERAVELQSLLEIQYRIGVIGDSE